MSTDLRKDKYSVVYSSNGTKQRESMNYSYTHQQELSSQILCRISKP